MRGNQERGKGFSEGVSSETRREERRQTNQSRWPSEEPVVEPLAAQWIRVHSRHPEEGLGSFEIAEIEKRRGSAS